MLAEIQISKPKQKRALLYKYDEKLFPNPNHTTLSAYVLKGNYHPHWNHWVISVCHLRDQDGAPPAKRQYPGATHEILIVSYTDVTMETEGEEIVKFEGTWLQPIDFCFQMQVHSDEKAVQIFEAFVDRFRQWETSPDQDFRQHNSRILTQLIATLS